MKPSYFYFLTFAACAGCPPTPTPYPVPDAEVTVTEAGPVDAALPDVSVIADAGPGPILDAGAMTDCMKACANLRVIQCSQASNCESVCQHVQDTRLTELNLPDCIKAADKKHLGKCSIHCQ